MLAPANELERIAAVRRYNILDTPPDGAFDRITALAARLFDVPISTVTIVDHDRIWFKSRYGLDADEIGRDAGLCASAICHLDPWVVTDAAVDVRTIDNPLVAGELGLRFYVGIPLTTAEGYSLGTLNVIGIEPREVTDDELQTLRDLAAIVVDELELRLDAIKKLEERRRRAIELNDEVVQSLAVAHLAFEIGHTDQARGALAEAIRSTQAIVSELLASAGEQGRLKAGDLVRRTAADTSSTT